MTESLTAKRFGHETEEDQERGRTYETCMTERLEYEKRWIRERRRGKRNEKSGIKRKKENIGVSKGDSSIR
jgi:hypothetical protein